MLRFLILLFSTLILGKVICVENCKPNICIVGGGIGGASASHFLKELFGTEVNIDLYEGKTVGGRLSTVEIDGNHYESGGSIIHSKNKYMQKFANLLGLEHRPSSDQRAGIWNGEEFVFEQSEWDVVTLAKLLYRYGIQPFNLNRYVSSIITDFEKIYDLQDAQKGFRNVTELLAALNADFPKLLEVSLKTHLTSLGYKEKLIDELVRATLVVNYGQGTNVQSFVGCVSLAAVGSGLWAVKGGNKKVPEHLIYRNSNVNVVPSYVKKIVNVSTKNKTLYEVHYKNKDSTILMKSVYDIVIIASPLTRDQEFPISFEGFPKTEFHSEGKYHKTIVTFVKADLKPHYFGLEEDIDSILSCDTKKTIISSVSRLDSVEGLTKDLRVWKIFSNAPLNATILNQMFSNIDDVKQVTWKAYPEYSTNIRLDKFKLHDALYHTNAIEWAASAMEMSAIGGRNVAILAHQDFNQWCTLKNTNNMFENTPKGTPSTEL